MQQSRLLLFGDQTVEKLDAIRKLTKQSQTTPTLKRFLRGAADVVQEEIAKLPLVERAAFYNFDDLLYLAEQNAAEETPHETCSSALMCIARIGETILYEENNPGFLMAAGSTLHVLALCTGLLPAAVAMMSSNTTDLLKYGLEVVAMSVRMGHELVIRSQNVDSSPGPWAYSIVGVTAAEVEAALTSFHDFQKIPLYKRAHVAVTSRTWTTVFGPPSTLERVWQECPELGLAPKLKLIAGADVHSVYLPSLDVARILGQSSILNIPLRHNVCCISTSTCRPYGASDLRSLLYLMLEDIMKHPLHLTETVHRVVSGLRGQQVDLFVVGPTAYTSLVQEALQTAQCSVNIIRSAETPPVARSSREGSNLVAIVGMSGRFPGSDNLQEFWNVLAEGRDLHEKIPPSRFDSKAHFDTGESKRNTTSALYGCFLQHPGLFDTRMFNISPREAIQMDPMQRMLLMTTYEALEMAGYNPEGGLSTTPARISTFFGQTTDDWRGNNESSDKGIDVYYVQGTTRAFHPSRLNYHFKWEGGSYSLDAACASSSTAVHMACSSLLSRESDTAIAGGANSLTAPALFAALSRSKFLSTTGNCKPFAEDADGYCRAEASGVVILKRLEDALAENDNILAVINGSGRNYSTDTPSITQPSAPAQQKLYKHILRKAGIDPLDVGYIEMHGTGTQAGDPVELESVGAVFCTGRTKDNPLYIGAVKANVGHGEAAAGITSLIKTVLMLRERRIPPHPRAPFRTNRKFPLSEKMRMKIPEVELPFETHSQKGDKKRRILLNNFDASGGNTCLIVEEFPRQKPRGNDPRSFHIITCSGRTSYSLESNKERLLRYLMAYPKCAAWNIAYSTTARRIHHSLRSSFVVQSTEQLIEHLTLDSNRRTKVEDHSSVVLAFTGQGSEFPGMGQQLFKSCKRFRESILIYQKICDSLGLPSVIQLISSSDIPKPTIIQSQLAIVMLELALAELWRSWGIQPNLVIGHSLGEYSALCVSGVLSVSDTLHLVGSRAAILERTCAPSTYAMLAVSDSFQNVERLCQDNTSCKVSCKNAPAQTVVSGLVDDLKQLEDGLTAAGIKTTYLRTPYGFHSAQVTPILTELEESAAAMHFSKPKIPIASTLLGKVISDSGTFSSKYLARQAREPVDFLGALQACAADAKVDEQSVWIELGPEAPCLGMIRSSLSVSPARLLPTIKSREENWKTLSAAVSFGYLAKLTINWKAYHEEYLDALTLLDLPFYAFDLKNYWSPYEQELLGPNVAQTPTVTLQTPTTPMTTCLQYIVEESLKNDVGSATFISYTSEPKLYSAIQGHRVGGVALCPASIFCDMAFTAAKYVYSKTNPTDSKVDISVERLEMNHPIIVSTMEGSQKIEVRAMKTSYESSVRVTFSSSSEGSPMHENGTCQILFDPNSAWKKEYGRVLHLVRKRADAIRQSALAGQAHRLLKPIVYNIFSNLVCYSENYQGIEEAFLDNGFRESTARIRLRVCLDAGKFTCNPYWIDNLLHLAGFVLNGDPAKPDNIAYIATALDGLYLIERLSEIADYTCYVSLQDSLDKRDALVGDIYIFSGEDLVAVCAGICFQRMHKRILATILGKEPSTTIESTQSRQSTAANKHQPKNVTADLVSLPPTGGVQKRQVPESVIDSKAKSNVADRLLAIILSETGFSAQDVDSLTAFADMGIDSLMSVSITLAAKKQLDMDLPASFFINNPTVIDMRRELDGSDEVENDDPITSSSKAASSGPNLLTGDSGIDSDCGRKDFTGTPSPSNASTSPAEGSELEQVYECQKPHPPVRKTAVVLLQGRSSSKENPVFLATDGAGSATAYIHIPPLSNGRRMYALESPFLRDPYEFNCSVEEFCSLYAVAIQENQPKGPYYIGGWSAGAVFAYETARQLSIMGEKIQCLFLMDMRVPRPMADALEPSVELIESAGLTTGIKRSGQIIMEAATELKQHLVGTVKALTKYKPKPMDPACRPARSFMVWAKRGSGDEFSSSFMKSVKKEAVDARVEDKNVMEDESTGMRGWFFAKREVFGANGWDELVGEIECHTMEADHFSMVQPPAVKELGKILRDALEKARS